MNGQIVGAAIASHHPGLMQCEEFRRLQGAGEDSDLIAGYARLRERIAQARPDVVVILDSHWFTTGYHLVDAGDRYTGTYVSDEMPWYLYGVPYDYRGHPELAYAIEAASRERGGFNRAVRDPGLGRHYASLNLVKQLRLELAGLPVVSVSSCSAPDCRWRDIASKMVRMPLRTKGSPPVMRSFCTPMRMNAEHRRSSSSSDNSSALGRNVICSVMQ